MKRAFLIFAALMLLLTPVLASADTIINGNGPANITVNCWDDWNNAVIGPNTKVAADKFITDPQNTNILFGEFLGAAVEKGSKAIVNGVSFFVFNTTGLPSPEVIVKLGNYPYDNYRKDITVCIDFVGGRYVKDVKTDLFDKEGNNIGSDFRNVATSLPTDGKQTFSYSVYPNPFGEQITFILDGACDWQVDKICITTQCVPTPIPGSVLLMGTGILGLVGVGIRRKL